MDFFIILLNKIINLLKYPTAILFAFLTFELAIVFYEIMESIFQHQTLYKYLFIGMGAYFVLWLVIFSNIQGNWFLTIEHESTHTLFALLTFHKILDFRATSWGGQMQFSGVGGGNWLITIAPYFFPTFSMIVIIFLQFSKPEYYNILVALLGYSILYHIHSTYKETSFHQPDIKEVGLLFSFLFLPSANLLAMIWVLSSIPNDRVDFLLIVENLYRYESVRFGEYYQIIFGTIQ